MPPKASTVAPAKKQTVKVTPATTTTTKPSASEKRPVSVAASEDEPDTKKQRHEISSDVSRPSAGEKRPVSVAASEDEPDTKKQRHEISSDVSRGNADDGSGGDATTAMSVDSSSSTSNGHADTSKSATAPAAAAATTTAVDSTAIEAKKRTALALRKVSHLMNIVMKRFPDAILPPCLWPLVAKVAIEKLRLKPNYFSNIKVNSCKNKKFPGHIDFVLTHSKLAGKTDIGMRMVNNNLKRGDEGFDSHFLMVSAPLMLLSHTTGPLGTFQDANQNITQHVKERAYPDQHKHMWSFKSTAYTAPDTFKHAMIDAECYAWERWLIALQCSYFMAIVEAEELKRSCKPKIHEPKDRRWYERTVFKLGDIFRIMKFTKFIAEQKRGKAADQTDKAVKDVERKIDANVAEIDLDDMFGLGDTHRPLPDSKGASAASSSADGPVASLEYKAECFANETGVVLSKEELDEYARMQKINEDCLTVLVNKIYVALVSGLADYKREKDEIRDGLNLGTTFKARTVPIKQFDHVDAPLAPEFMHPIIADSIEPYIAEGHLSATANVFEYKKERVDNAMWEKTRERLHKNSKATQQIPILGLLFKERDIILKHTPMYAGFSNTELDVEHRFNVAGDIVQPTFYIRCTLDAPVDVKGEKIIFFNQKLDVAAMRQMFRPNAARKAAMMRSNYTPVGKLAIDENDFSANPDSSTTAMTIVDESDVAARVLTTDEMELLALLQTPDDKLSFPTFHEVNHKLLAESTPFYNLDAAGASKFLAALAIDAQKQITAKASENGNHVDANFQAPRQLTAAVRKQLAAPTAAPDFGEGNDYDDNDAYAEDAGAEYVDNP